MFTPGLTDNSSPKAVPTPASGPRENISLMMRLASEAVKSPESNVGPNLGLTTPRSSIVSLATAFKAARTPVCNASEPTEPETGSLTERALDMKVLQLANKLILEREERENLCQEIKSLQADNSLLRSANKSDALKHEENAVYLQRAIDELQQSIKGMRNQHHSESENYRRVTDNLLSELEGYKAQLATAQEERDTSSTLAQESKAQASNAKAAFELLSKDMEDSKMIHESEIRSHLAQLEAHRHTISELQSALEIADNASKREKRLADRHEEHMANITESHDAEIERMQRLLDTSYKTLQEFQDELHLVQESRESLIGERDQALAKARRLETKKAKRGRQVDFVDQLVILCVDASNSSQDVFHQVKQVYRDLLVFLKTKNSDTKVAVITHGHPNNLDVAPPEMITTTTLQLLNSVNTAGTEDYSYCLSKANEIIGSRMGMGSVFETKVIIMIGDGNAICDSSSGIEAEILILQRQNIPAHSVIVPNGSKRFKGYTMTKISEETEGVILTIDNYLSELDRLSARI
ncbi:hypothetical protein JX265_009849 [Neoarthrinium moseri]|uniref:VWFA domain-containing protein n=1 Tax=Neoarthrinium moseri TaxID=1658444 RepID=A0A9Q0AKU3_9PEZI|nr:hypothetical protein JX265_009849 [Neoarthrinium moseri]